MPTQKFLIGLAATALVALAMPLAALTPPAHSAEPKPPRVSVTTNASGGKPGDTFELTVAVKRGAPRQKVALQQRKGSTWKSVASKRLPRKGVVKRVGFKSVPQRAGLFRYRAKLLRQGAVRGATSDMVRLRVTAPVTPPPPYVPRPLRLDLSNAAGLALPQTVLSRTVLARRLRGRPQPGSKLATRRIHLSGYHVRHRRRPALSNRPQRQGLRPLQQPRELVGHVGAVLALGLPPRRGRPLRRGSRPASTPLCSTSVDSAPEPGDPVRRKRCHLLHGQRVRAFGPATVQGRLHFRSDQRQRHAQRLPRTARLAARSWPAKCPRRAPPGAVGSPRVARSRPCCPIRLSGISAFPDGNVYLSNGRVDRFLTGTGEMDPLPWVTSSRDSSVSTSPALSPTSATSSSTDPRRRRTVASSHPTDSPPGSRSRCSRQCHRWLQAPFHSAPDASGGRAPPHGWDKREWGTRPRRTAPRQRREGAPWGWRRDRLTDPARWTPTRCGSTD